MGGPNSGSTSVTTAVAEAHDSWDYKSQGLSGPAAAMISIALAVATYGVGASVGAAAGLTTTTAVAGGGTAFTTAGVMANAAFTSLVTQASLSLINNQGNLGAVLKDLGSRFWTHKCVTRGGLRPA